MLDVRANGDVWRLTGPAGRLPPLTSPRTAAAGWHKLFAGATVGTDPVLQQAGC